MEDCELRQNVTKLKHSKGAACTELQKSPLRKWHTILRRSPLNFKALNFYVQTNFAGTSDDYGWKLAKKDSQQLYFGAKIQNENDTFSSIFFWNTVCCKVSKIEEDIIISTS